MERREEITCECGGRLRRPIPPTCPHCGRKIVAVKSEQTLGQQFLWLSLSLLAIVLMFAVVVLYFRWLAGVLAPK